MWKSFEQWEKKQKVVLAIKKETHIGLQQIILQDKIREKAGKCMGRHKTTVTGRRNGVV